MSKIETLCEELYHHAPERVCRMLLRPDHVQCETVQGVHTVEMAWREEDHSALVAAVDPWHGAHVFPGAVLHRVGDALVLRRIILPVKDAWIDEGRISELAMATLRASIALGKNILIAGEWVASTELVCQVLAHASRPMAVLSDDEPAPVAWLRGESVWGAEMAGVDGIAAWGLPSTSVSCVLKDGSGVCARVDAGEIPVALMRLERDLGSTAAQSVTGMLSSLQLVVLLGRGDAAGRVTQLCEVVPHGDAYRLQPLFLRGDASMGHALLPAGMPSFAGALPGIGAGALAEDLRFALPSFKTMPTQVQEIAERIDEPTPPSHAKKPHGTKLQSRAFQLAPSPPGTRSPRSRLRDEVTRQVMIPEEGPDPGWELDHLSDDIQTEEIQSESDAGYAATMAATYGLGPPPKPVRRNDDDIA